VLAKLDAVDAVLVDIPFDRYIAQAMTGIARSKVPDLPDRITAATALYLKVPLISRDRAILVSGLETIWQDCSR